MAGSGALDALLPWLQPRTDTARRAVDALLNGDGYVVLRSVLSEAECAAELERMWSFVTKVRELAVFSLSHA